MVHRQRNRDEEARPRGMSSPSFEWRGRERGGRLVNATGRRSLTSNHIAPHPRKIKSGGVEGPSFEFMHRE